MRLHTKIILLIGAVALGIGLASSFLVSQMMHETLNSELRDQGVLAVETLAEHIAHNVIDGDVIHARESAMKIVDRLETIKYAYIIGFDGNVFAHTFEGGFPRAFTTRLHKPASVAAQEPEIVEYATDMGGILDVRVPLIEGMAAHVHIGMSEAHAEAKIASLRNRIIGLALSLALAGVAIGAFVSRRMTRPLAEMARSMRDFGEWKKEKDIIFGGGGREIEDLTRSFNRMITERTQAEEARERARLFMQTVIDGFPEMLMVINRDYTIALANRAVREMTGGTDPVAACLKCHQVSHDSPTPCDDAEHPCPLEQVVATKAPVTVEHIHYDTEGNEVFFEIIAAPIFDEKGEVVQIIESCRDLTAHKQAEEQRLDLERQVQHAQKLESLGVLAGGIAHDFNNLLMVILGNADLAMDELSQMAPARENITEILKASKRATELAKQMLAYSGKGRFVIEPIGLNEFVEEMAHLLEVSISKKAVLKYNFAENLPTIDCDATQIRQIIMNLITNASEAIGDKSGVIALSTGAMDCDRAYLDGVDEILRAGLDEPLSEGLYAYFEVADTGCGMDAETIERIFDPFFTTKFTGRGLGMAAVLGIVRGHNGAIKIYSEVGKGTTFKVLFPAGESPAGGAAIQGRDMVQAQAWRGRGTVLIADDEETVCAVGKQMLSRMGFSVLTAVDGREAVDVFRAHADEIDCVLLDLTMPHMDGEQAFRELRRIRPDVTVILCSGYNQQDATQRFAGKGLAGFIQKPYSMAALRETLMEVLPDDKA